MATKRTPIKIEYNIPLECGQDAKVVFVNKDMPITVKKGRMLASLDFTTATDKYNKKKDKVYMDKIPNTLVELDGDLYSVGFWLLRAVENDVDIKEIKKGFINEELEL